MSARLADLRAFYASIPRRERLAVAAAMAFALVLVVAFVPPRPNPEGRKRQ